MHRSFFIFGKIMITRKVTTDWIKSLIRSGKVYQFYLTKEWIMLRERKRAIEHYECERCRKRGRYSPCEAVHHKLYLRDRPDLALDIKNLECLCKECHYQEHHKFKISEQLNEERW